MWLSYRGACSSAEGYGLALRAWLDLNRFRLYQALNLQPLADVAEERTRNAALADMANGVRTFDVQLDETRMTAS